MVIDHLIPARFNPTKFRPPQGDIFELKVIQVDRQQ